MINTKIPVDQIIRCNSFQLLPEVYQYTDANKDQTPPPGLVHVHIDDALEFCQRHADNGFDYVLLSTCSDLGLCYQQENPYWLDFPKGMRMMQHNEFTDNGYRDIQFPPRVHLEKCSLAHPFSIKTYSWTFSTLPGFPGNVKHWFMTNCNVSFNEIEPLPFGIFSKPVPEPNDIAHKIAAKPIIEDKPNLLYINYQDYTIDRVESKAWFRARPWATVKGGVDTDEFIDDVANSKFTLCMPGNGWDSYRIWESLYLGSIPVVYKNRTSTELFRDLPVLQIDDYRELNEEFLNLRYHGYALSHPIRNFNYDKLTVDYWRKKLSQSLV
jgi:hypothetical protein